MDKFGRTIWAQRAQSFPLFLWHLNACRNPATWAPSMWVAWVVGERRWATHVHLYLRLGELSLSGSEGQGIQYYLASDLKSVYPNGLVSHKEKGFDLQLPNSWVLLSIGSRRWKGKNRTKWYFWWASKNLISEFMGLRILWNEQVSNWRPK